jgi:hypothetical protein
MLKSVRNVVFSLLVWYAIVGCAIAGMSVVARAASTGPEAHSYLMRAFWLGILVILLIWSVCRVLRRLPAIVLGTILGLSMPIFAGWIWVHWIENFSVARGLLWNGTDLWFQGFQIAIPSAIAGGIVGYFLARKVERAPQGQA